MMMPRLPQTSELKEYENGSAAYGPAGVQSGWSLPPSEAQGISWARYAEALKRHLPAIVIVIVAGTAAGYYASRRVKPLYQAQAKVWVEPARAAQQTGPIRSQQLLAETSWIELLRSFAIVDQVVHDLRLNVSYARPGDSIFFQGFDSQPSLRPGGYVLKVDDRKNYVLSTKAGDVIERGIAGDSVGRKVGFGWAPASELFTPGKSLAFSVTTPRSVSAGLVSQVRASLPDDGQFLTISLSGQDPKRTSNILNAWVEQFVASSGELKKRHLREFKRILSAQLNHAEQELRTSEIQLEQFRVNTITLPSDASPVNGGVKATRDPAITNYFEQKQALVDIQNERAALEDIITKAKGGALNTQLFLQLPSLLSSSPQLRTAMDEVSSRQAALRSEQQFLTDANPRIKQLKESLRVLERQTIPALAEGALQILRSRERDMNSRVSSQARELRAIPTRTIEEMRLVRQVAATEKLYSVLRSRYEEVALAEAQTSPDLSVLDFAAVPLFPSSNEAPRFFLLSILASVGLAGALALLHDRLDRRFRYPEQATHDLGLVITGTVPRFRPDRKGHFAIETMSQAVESFRTLRLGIRYEFPANVPVVLAVSSANAGDGKSLVSSNLALAFADAGHRTLLVDGDVRRGIQHTTFDVPVVPGLVEYLLDDSSVEEVIKPTSSGNLFVLPRGTRRNRAPELLVSEKMLTLMQLARQKFDVVIIDAPPLVAGVDAYALGAAAGSILIVLRPGVSDRKLAAAKLTVLDRLPIRVLGTVLNGVPLGGLYRYYGTDYAYRSGRDADPVGNIATPGGLVLRA